MRKVTLYIAVSLDGYIADRNGAVDWLHGQDSGAEDLNTYPDFIKGMDTVVMGWNTYRQIVEELCHYSQRASGHGKHQVCTRRSMRRRPKAEAGTGAGNLDLRRGQYRPAPGTGRSD